MQQNWKFQRGDIFFTHFGASTGSEQCGDRPAVILQNDVGNYHSPTLIVATMTSKAEKKVNQPTHCLLENAGLNMPSVVQAEQMFKDYPDVVSVDILQEMLGICRKNAYLLVKQNKIHSARVGRSYKIPKLCVVEYLIDQNRQLGGMRLSNSLAPYLQNTPESSKLMMPKQRTFGCEQKGASL